MTASLAEPKVVSIIRPQAAVNNDDPVGAYGDANPVSVDTRGFHKATIVVDLGATDAAMTALGVYSGASAASGADDSNFSAITGLQASGSSGDGRLPTATDDNSFFTFEIDLRNDDVGRYLALDCTIDNQTTGAFVTAVCLLSRADISPTSATEKGAAWVLSA